MGLSVSLESHWRQNEEQMLGISSYPSLPRHSSSLAMFQSEFGTIRSFSHTFEHEVSPCSLTQCQKRQSEMGFELCGSSGSSGQYREE